MANKTRNNEQNNVYREALITLLNRIDFEEFCNVCCYRDNGCDGNASVKCYGGEPIYPPCADDFCSIVEDTADALANDEEQKNNLYIPNLKQFGFYFVKKIENKY